MTDIQTGASPRQRRQQRIVGAIVMAPCVALLAAAWSLTPRTIGYGTAGQLDIPDCSILIRTGYPCPTCGMTTSVSATAHGQLGLAFKAHPFGIVLFAVAAALAVASLWQLVSGRSVLGRLRWRWWWVLVGLAGLVISWRWVLFSGVRSGTWPIR